MSSFGHSVKPGDTFYKLAQQYLGDGNRWSEIARLNPDRDPNNLLIDQIVFTPNSPN